MHSKIGHLIKVSRVSYPCDLALNVKSSLMKVNDAWRCATMLLNAWLVPWDLHWCHCSLPLLFVVRASKVLRLLDFLLQMCTTPNFSLTTKHFEKSPNFCLLASLGNGSCIPPLPWWGLFSCPKQLNRWPCHWLTDWLTDSLTDSGYFYFWHTKSDPRDLWPLRHLIRVMRRHDLTLFF